MRGQMFFFSVPTAGTSASSVMEQGRGNMGSLISWVLFHQNKSIIIIIIIKGG